MSLRHGWSDFRQRRRQRRHDRRARRTERRGRKHEYGADKANGDAWKSGRP